MNQIIWRVVLILVKNHYWTNLKLCIVIQWSMMLVIMMIQKINLNKKNNMIMVMVIGMAMAMGISWFKIKHIKNNKNELQQLQKLLIKVAAIDFWIKHIKIQLNQFNNRRPNHQKIITVIMTLIYKKYY